MNNKRENFLKTIAEDVQKEMNAKLGILEEMNKWDNQIKEDNPDVQKQIEDMRPYIEEDIEL